MRVKCIIYLLYLNISVSNMGNNSLPFSNLSYVYSWFVLTGILLFFRKLVLKHGFQKTSIWLCLNSQKYSIFTTILKFHPFTQVHKIHHKKKINKNNSFRSQTMQIYFRNTHYKKSPLGPLIMLREQSCKKKVCSTESFIHTTV